MDEDKVVEGQEKWCGMMLGQELHYSKESAGVPDVGIQGNDIKNHYQDFGGRTVGSREISKDFQEMLGV